MLLIGVDGGGTRTRAVASDETGAILGFGMGGTSNYNNVGTENALREIMIAIEEACRTAGRSATEISAAFLGLAGVKAPQEREALSCDLTERGLSGRIVVANDAEAALAGGLSDRPGIVLIAGTGSHCYGRDARGHDFFCGGWGWMLDDIGSGFFLGLGALRAVARAADGRGKETDLTRIVFEQIGISHPFEMSERLYVKGLTTAKIASFATEVVGCATKGDAVARELVNVGTTGLAELVQITAAKLTWDTPVEVVFTGGLALSQDLYGQMLRQAVRDAVPECQIREPELPPVCGGVLRAAELADVRETAEFAAKLRENWSKRS